MFMNLLTNPENGPKICFKEILLRSLSTWLQAPLLGLLCLSALENIMCQGLWHAISMNGLMNPLYRNHKKLIISSPENQCLLQCNQREQSSFDASLFKSHRARILFQIAFYHRMIIFGPRAGILCFPARGLVCTSEGKRRGETDSPPRCAIRLEGRLTDSRTVGQTVEKRFDNNWTLEETINLWFILT